MRRPTSLAVATALVAGLCFAAAQPSGEPDRDRLTDRIRVGQEVLLTSTPDGTAFFVELLTDEQRAETDRVGEAAEADARRALDAAMARFREVQKPDAAAAGDTPGSVFTELAVARERLDRAEADAGRRAHRVVEAGEDYFTYEEEAVRPVHVPLGRVVTVTQRKGP